MNNKECPECGSENIITINSSKFVCDKWCICLDCGNEFDQTFKGE